MLMIWICIENGIKPKGLAKSGLRLTSRNEPVTALVLMPFTTFRYIFLSILL